MPDPNDTVPTGAPADTGAPATPPTDTLQPPEGTDQLDAGTPGSAPDDGTQAPPPPETPVPGSEPPEEPKAVRELKEQRRKRQEAERDAQYWKGVAEGRIQPPGQPSPPPASSTPAEPDPAAFATYEEYRVAQNTYVRDMASFVAREEVQREIAGRKAAEVHTTFLGKVTEAGKKDPELLEALADPTFLPANIPAAGFIAQVIKESDAAPAMIRHFLDNREELDRLYGLHPLTVAKELGKIEARILAKAPAAPVEPRKVSQAPEPITPVSSGAPSPGEVDLEKLPMDEFMKRRNPPMGRVKIGERK